ncbi:DNA mismatch repair protein MutL [Pseudopedobacter saltans DSM 12145]|uniref:DNA mismatch repair protein MutL n=1 Tax=Pseudopedobacter saltans (strain ATCC 51119 / DSM 12145 / JCM 21818 / CCUG 39354 / LMG 10337 / NBRC 100064 / NCIMB 13643) TaxID=762903 RepID=F0SE61_PSESL|nr:DNA mismatch repair endonuclease MutL [Pseudopedobacter saltans]ADY53983.1 DNA mismatch repair protein MutL [Pseudopedobacter saltans DSM 12145]
MSDIIQLLPDSVANQIAAGEVVQRPASAVKELIENSIDAGADKIQLIIKDAGKTLIQIIDNGCGMSPTDARMCLERHATSKIRKAEDLFAIRTMGFRGEAMASIAAIAQMEIKTKRHEDELGNSIIVEGSEVINQEPCAGANGTSISVKNLFFNIPARRNFLKSNAVEMRHIIDEFQRVALAHPEIHFTLHHDGQEVYHLPQATLKQRIIHLLGNNYNERLVPVDEDTSIIQLKGFIGKPSFAKKTRGDQFFFVNKRFIKDPYLNHAVMAAYEELLTEDSFPLYVLFIDIDPSRIDINVHPTKTEIKYQDDKAIYAIIRSAVKRSLGKYNITPTLDFDQETGFERMITHKPLDEITPPQISFNPNFNPFGNEVSTVKSKSDNFRAIAERTNSGSGNWSTLYNIVEQEKAEQIPLDLGVTTTVSLNQEDSVESPVADNRNLFQIHQKYIISQIKSGFMLIDQQAAHERILYEKFLEQLESHKGLSQQSLFPQTITLNAMDFALVNELLPSFHALGFQIREFGKNTLVIEGVPADIPENHNLAEMMEKLIEGFKNNYSTLKLDKRDNLARTLAKNASIKAGTVLKQEEMNNLIDQLFACNIPGISISGKQIIIKITLDELAERFNKS